MNENDLIKGCIENDIQAQKALHEAYFGKMMGIALRYAKDQAEAEEIVKNSFLKTYHEIKHKPEEISLDSWIKEITIQEAIQQYKLHHKEEQLIASTVHILDHNQLKDVKVPENPDFDISKEDLLSALPSLSSSYRMLLNLHLIDGYNFEKIAQFLDLNKETARSNFEKALFTLKKILVHHKKQENHVSSGQ